MAVIFDHPGPAHDFERHRDVPRSCTCGYCWWPQAARWLRMYPDPDCTWHYPQTYPQEVSDGR